MGPTATTPSRPGRDEPAPHVRELIVAARLWSSGRPIDLAAIAARREQAVLANHRRYLAQIPVYRALAEESGIGPDSGVDEIREGMILTDDAFKAYDPSWPSEDLPALTRWVGTISTLDTDGWRIEADDVAGWRDGMRRHGASITFSSGSRGPRSIIPRDHVTLAALRSSSGVSLPWALRPGTFDCVLFTDAGLGVGIQAGASGLASGAVDVHTPWDADDLDRALDHVVDALRACATGGRPTLLYGPPGRLLHVAHHLSGRGEHIPLAAGSSLVTGGGWKGGSTHDMATLFAILGQHLGLAPDRCVDTFSCAELNTVMVSCAAGRYHVPPVVEALVLDDLLRPLPGVEATGRLALLDPFARSYPGFFTTGDAVTLCRSACDCGLAGSTLVPPIQRVAGAATRGCGVVDPAIG